MSLTNAVISSARSMWYRATEPVKLRYGRFVNGDYDLDGFFWNDPNPRISVIIPTFNRIGLLTERCMPSVFAQTHRNLEVLVCAHGCTDGTNELWRSGVVRVIEVPRVRTYPPTPENHWFAGPVAPINAGLFAAKGQWIARIDDDDTWTPTHIADLLKFAIEGDFEFVSAAHETDKGRVAPYLVDGIPIGGVQTWLYRSYLKTFRANPDCWRKKWNRVNDTDLQERFVSAGVRMGYLDKVVAHVLPRPGETEIGLRAYKSNNEITAKYAFR